MWRKAGPAPAQPARVLPTVVGKANPDERSNNGRTEVARRIFSGSRARLAWAEEGQDVEAIIISSSAAVRRWITLLATLLS